jgi:hypothetical protein
MPSLTTLVDGTVPVAADFNTNFQALNNAIGSLTAISAWATGEMPYASSANTWSRLSPGSAGQVLTMGASVPAWAAATGVVDQLCGLAMSNGSDATNDIDISVGAAASDDATYANRILMTLTSGLTKQLDAAWAVGTNQGGRDTGSIADGTWHVFLIERVDTGVVDVLFSASATAPTLPTSYTKQRRIGSILREAGAIVAFTQDADEFLRSTPVLDVDITNPGTSAVTRTLKVPTGVKVRAMLNVEFIPATSTQNALYLSSLDVTDGAASLTVAPLGTAIGGTTSAINAIAGGVPATIRTNTSAQIRSRMATSAAGDTLRIATLGWVDRRGKG